MTTATATCICPFCGGSGKLPHFSHIQNGDCFACGATGELRDINAFIGDNSDLVLTVYVNNGTFSGAEIRRRTWKIALSSIGQYKEWGRDSFFRVITDADEARQIWRNAKRLGVLTELVNYPPRGLPEPHPIRHSPQPENHDYLSLQAAQRLQDQLASCRNAST